MNSLWGGFHEEVDNLNFAEPLSLVDDRLKIKTIIRLFPLKRCRQENACLEKIKDYKGTWKWSSSSAVHSVDSLIIGHQIKFSSSNKSDFLVLNILFILLFKINNKAQILQNTILYSVTTFVLK